MTAYYMPAPVAPDKLRFWIAARGFTHRAFAEAGGIAINTVSRWCNGRTVITPQRKSDILTICELLEIAPLDLIADGADPNA